MNWDSLKNTLLETGAPILGNMIGGPAGGLVANWLVSEFGDKADPSDPVQIENAIKADPEAFFKLQGLQALHKEKIQELQLEMTKVEIQDRQGARDRESNYIKSTGHVDYFMSALGFIIVAGFFSITGLMIFSDNQAELAQNQPLNIMLGFLGGALMAVVQYYFGSSKGSSDKNKMSVGK